MQMVQILIDYSRKYTVYLYYSTTAINSIRAGQLGLQIFLYLSLWWNTIHQKLYGGVNSIQYELI